ncbi:MAG: UDP-N-acetylmuramoyl-tripeptide--D-alanyl-D-alanine ligase [Phycisphaerae bacterium]|nr:UDP-N-acetylmuramoyl-tripeptide--D-alanyl-D-alanine ligase [Phycisphaerae bacterium]
MKPILLEEIKRALHAELKTQLSGQLVRSIVIDSRQCPAGSLFVALRGENCDGHDYIDQAVAAGAVAVLIDRDVPLSPAVKDAGVTVLKVDDCVIALGELAKFYRSKFVSGTHVIAVTGSNGKTTVREMIYHVLSRFQKGIRSEKNYNNQIGLPLTIFNIQSDDQFAVVELGTNAPGEIAYLSRIAQGDVAVITNIGPAHLQGFGDIEGVSAEKTAITAGLKDHGMIICNAEHKPTLDKLHAQGRKVITFGLDDNCDVSAHYIKRLDDGYSFITNDRCPVHIPVLGLHNVKNALAALAVVRRLGITSMQFAEAIEDFRSVPGRMDFKTFNSITVIDDTYNANPASMKAALEELTSMAVMGRRVMVCGDMGEMGSQGQEFHRQLGHQIAASNIDLLLAVGPLASLTAKAALDAGMGWSKVQRAVNSKRMARLIKPMLLDGDTVLVKGARSMQMENIVKSLSRWKGKNTTVTR